jgi:hypothetical protein
MGTHGRKILGSQGEVGLGGLAQIPDLLQQVLGRFDVGLGCLILFEQVARFLPQGKVFNVRD